jgi:FkbM family methyltransferase
MNLSFLKRLSLATGTYRVARSMQRHLWDRKRLLQVSAEISLYKRHIPPGAMCFDVGANIGERTEALLRAGYVVTAFEPQEECIRELMARCKPYRGLNLVQVALGDAPGILPLFVRSSSGQSGMVSAWEGNAIAVVDVPLLTLDIAIARYGIPFYVKIDVEGYELQVLKGLAVVIPLVSMEYHLTQEDIAKTMMCVTRLRELGMRFVNASPAETPNFYCQNGFR